MKISTIIILAVATMALATFANPRGDCRHACRMDTNGVAVVAASHPAPVMFASIR